jgi:iron-sulfur cluster assembly protein
MERTERQMTTPPISLSAKASQEIKHIMAHKNIPAGYGLRVGIRSGGCGGATSFILGFDKPKETDDLFLINDISIYIDKKHLMYLIGLEIDFIERKDERGFTFIANS